jgi:hypothetical protein
MPRLAPFIAGGDGVERIVLMRKWSEGRHAYTLGRAKGMAHVTLNFLR